MAEGVDSIPDTLHSLQMKVHHLEAVNKVLEMKWLDQNERLERLLAHFSLRNSKITASNESEELDQLLARNKDFEQLPITRNTDVDKEEKDELTVDRSIHKLPLTNILGTFRIFRPLINRYLRILASEPVSLTVTLRV